MASELHAEPEPLPDYVVPPASEAARPSTPIPEPAPEPEPAVELEPLPDYIVDPSRPAPPKEEDDRRQAAEASPATFPGLIPKPSTPEPSREPSAAEAAGIYFPPVTSFPPLREEDEATANGPREPRRAPRRRPPAEQGKSKRKRSLEEPGDDAGDGTWMAGLHNRLSAYSLAEEEAEDPEGAEPAADGDEA